MTMEHWLAPFQGPLDVVGFALFLLVFPIYHAVYPYLARGSGQLTPLSRFDLYRESWIQGLIERRDLIAAAQQTRNLTMVNSILVSSALILMGLTANLLIRLPQMVEMLPNPDESWISQPDAVVGKLYLLILTFAAAFSYCMTSLRHLGHFVLLIGADPELIAKHEGGSPVKYFAVLINRASHRYTLGVRCFYSAFPLFGWLIDARLFLAFTVFWGVKFFGFQDFSYLLRRPRSAAAVERPKSRLPRSAD